MCYDPLKFILCFLGLFPSTFKETKHPYILGVLLALLLVAPAPTPTLGKGVGFIWEAAEEYGRELRH